MSSPNLVATVVEWWDVLKWRLIAFVIRVFSLQLTFVRKLVFFHSKIFNQSCLVSSHLSFSAVSHCWARVFHTFLQIIFLNIKRFREQESLIYRTTKKITFHKNSQDVEWKLCSLPQKVLNLSEWGFKWLMIFNFDEVRGWNMVGLAGNCSSEEFFLKQK